MFPRNALPDLTVLRNLSSLVMTRCQGELDGNKLFVNGRLLELVELVITSSCAERALTAPGGALPRVKFESRDKIEPQISIVRTPPASSLKEKLMDVMDLSDCLYIGARLPDKLLTQVCTHWAGSSSIWRCFATVRLYVVPSSQRGRCRPLFTHLCPFSVLLCQAVRFVKNDHPPRAKLEAALRDLAKWDRQMDEQLVWSPHVPLVFVSGMTGG
jgi:hypothetical protein